MAPHLSIVSQRLTRASREGNARLIISMPPRHGKSQLVSEYYPAWRAGIYPDRRVILTSYEADFAASWGRKARQLLEQHGHLFGVKVSSDSSAANRWDIAGRDGGMITAGVGGPITGKGADDLIIDDPIKNYEDAHSETMREKTWQWFTSTAYTRLEPNANVIVIATRWHMDDLTGRILRELPHERWEEIIFPAIATDADVLGRKPGDALWPQRYSVQALESIRKTIGNYQFSALYQQCPTPPEGEMFKRHWFPQVNAAPMDAEYCRAWDKAGTTAGGDHTAGVLLCKGSDGIWHLVDVVRGQWSSWERNKIIKTTSFADAAQYQRYSVVVEIEPGSGGKESGEITVKELAGLAVKADRVTGDKETRARPFAAQCEAGNVRMVRGSWNRMYLDELCSFPNGVHDDMVDASSGAFNHIALVRRLTAWVL